MPRQGNNINQLNECMVALPQARWKTRGAGLARFRAKQTIDEENANENYNVNVDDDVVDDGYNWSGKRNLNTAPRVGAQNIGFYSNASAHDDDTDSQYTGSVFERVYTEDPNPISAGANTGTPQGPGIGTIERSE